MKNENKAVEQIEPGPNKLPPGLRYARISGLGLGLFLVYSAISGWLSAGTGAMTLPLWAKCIFQIIYGILLLLPWGQTFPKKTWIKLYVGLMACSVAFVFILVFEAILRYMDFVEAGLRPGLPALQGTLIFLGLLQLPTALFVRRPDLLE